MNKYKKIELLVLFLLSLTPFFWLRDSLVVLGHDSGFRTDSYEYLKNLFFSWGSIPNYGFDWSIFKGFLITQAPEALFTSLAGSLHTGQLFTFIFWFFVIGLSMYIFVSAFFPQKEFWLIRLLSSSLYMYNFFLLQGWFIVERAKFSLYAALPLGLLVIYKTVTREYSLLKGSILFALVYFFLNGGGFPSLYGGVLLVYLLTFFYLGILQYVTKGVRGIVHTVMTAFAFLLATIPLNAFWLLPQLYLIRNTYSTGLSSQGGIEGITAWEGVISKYANFINLFRLQGIPDWYNNVYHPYANFYLQNPFLIVLSFFFIGVILLGLYFYKTYHPDVKKEGLLYLILFIFLVGTIFTAGSHPPFGVIYLFLVKNVPGFVIFRSSLYKFGPALWFSFSFLSAYFFTLLLQKFVHQKKLLQFLGIAVIFLTLMYHFPFFSNKFFVWNKPFTTLISLPSYTEEIAAHLDSSKSFSRTLLLPQLHSYFKADSYQFGFWSLWPLPDTLVTHASIIANDSNANQEIAKDVYKTFNTASPDDVSRFLGAVGINKLLWRGDVLYSDKVVTSSDLNPVKDVIKTLPGVTMAKKAGAWEVYDISSPYYLPLFYVPERVDYVKSGISHREVLQSIETPVRYASILQPQTQQIPTQVSAVIVQADCILCEEQGVQQLSDSTTIPNARLLPDSLFYSYTRIKEARLIHDTPKDPQNQIDLHLTLASNRYAEFLLLYRSRQTENAPKISNQIFLGYKQEIEAVFADARKFSGTQQNYYWIKVFAYLSRHRQELLNSRDYFSDASFVDWNAYIQEKSNIIKKKIWMTPSWGDRRYLLEIPESGEYQILFSNSSLKPKQAIFDDGITLPLSGRIQLKEGIHKVQLKYDKQRNLVRFKHEQEAHEVSLTYKDQIEYGIKDFSPNKKYIIRFKYKKQTGRTAPSLLIVQKNINGMIINTIDKSLERNDSWNNLYFLLTPEPSAQSVSLFLTQKNFSDDVTQMDLKDISVEEVPDYHVYLLKQRATQEMVVPKIAYQKINPTKYTVKIRDAKTPYFLSFGENYNPGWKISFHNQQDFLTARVASFFNDTIIEYAPQTSFLDKHFLDVFTSQKNTPDSHYQVNGYANGWYIDKTGDYDITVEYAPQRFVYFGVILSLLTLLSFLSIILIVRFRYEKKSI